MEVNKCQATRKLDISTHNIITKSRAKNKMLLVMLQEFLLKKPVVPPPDIIAKSRTKNKMLLQKNVLQMFCHPNFADDDITDADGIDNDFENDFMSAAAEEQFGMINR